MTSMSVSNLNFQLKMQQVEAQNLDQVTLEFWNDLVLYLYEDSIWWKS